VPRNDNLPHHPGAFAFAPARPPAELTALMPRPSLPEPASPRGELVIRTIAMPADTNSKGDIFGGWLLSQMDLGGAVRARNVAHGRVATVAIEGMSFLYPVFVGDIVTCYARLQGIGRTSMKIDLEAWVQRQTDGSVHRVTEGIFTYVALDEAGRPRPVRRDP